MKAGVFIALGGIQIVATAIIVLCVSRYRDMYCPTHLSHQPKQGSHGTGRQLGLTRSDGHP